MMTYKQLREEKYIDVYSIQEPHALECLKQCLEKGEAYIPLLEKSHAKKCKNSKRAYRWMAAQFKKRMGRRPKAKDAFFWMSFDEEKKDRAKEQGKKYKIKLFVPTHEILASLYNGWTKVLDNARWNGRSNNAFTAIQPIERTSTRKSWEDVFPHDNDLISDLQGVIDRVKPQWVKEITEVINE